MTPQFKVDDEVYYQPALIGYGYVDDERIPATVLRVHRTRCTIVFATKDGEPVPPRVVSPKNLMLLKAVSHG